MTGTSIISFIQSSIFHSHRTHQLIESCIYRYNYSHIFNYSFTSSMHFKITEKYIETYTQCEGEYAFHFYQMKLYMLTKFWTIMFYGLPPPQKGLMRRISLLIKYIASKPLISTQNHMISLTSFLDMDSHKNYIGIKTLY